MTGRLQEERILKFPGRFTWISAKAKDAKVWWARKPVNSGRNQKPGRLWRGGSPGSSPRSFPHLPLGGALSPLNPEALESGGCSRGALLVVLGGLCVEDAVESWLRPAGCPRIWCHSG